MLKLLFQCHEKKTNKKCTRTDSREIGNETSLFNLNRRDIIPSKLRTDLIIFEAQPSQCMSIFKTAGEIGFGSCFFFSPSSLSCFLFSFSFFISLTLMFSFVFWLLFPFLFFFCNAWTHQHMQNKTKKKPKIGREKLRNNTERVRLESRLTFPILSRLVLQPKVRRQWRKRNSVFIADRRAQGRVG